MSAVLPTRPDPLELLNEEQRQAAEHGLGEQAGDTRPLLVIAGAGSGKTNTLAHRVANVILQGADPPGSEQVIADFLTEAGFGPPSLFFSSLFWGAWIAYRAGAPTGS